MGNVLGGSLIILGSLVNVASRVKSIILDDFNILGLIVDSAFKLLVLGVVILQSRQRLLEQHQFDFFLASPNVNSFIDETVGFEVDDVLDHLTTEADSEFKSPRPRGLSHPVFALQRETLLVPQTQRSQSRQYRTHLLTDSLRDQLLASSDQEAPAAIVGKEVLLHAKQDWMARSNCEETFSSYSEPVPTNCVQYACHAVCRDLFHCVMRVFRWFGTLARQALNNMTKYVSGLPNAKWLVVIGIYDTIGFSVLAYTQSKVPGPVAVATDIALVPWTALLSYWCLQKRYTIVQNLGILCLTVGAYVALALTPNTPKEDRVFDLPPVPTGGVPVTTQTSVLLYAVLRMISFAPLAYTLVLREKLIEAYDAYAETFSYGYLSYRSTQSSTDFGREQKWTLSVPLFFFGITACQFAFSPVAISVVLFMAGTKKSLAEAWSSGANCLRGASPECTMAPMAYAFYLTLVLVFDLLALVYLKTHSALSVISLAQLIGPVTILMYHYLPIAELKSVDRELTTSLWVGIALIVLGQVLHNRGTYSQDVMPSDSEAQPESISFQGSADEATLFNRDTAFTSLYLKDDEFPPQIKESSTPSSFTRQSPFYAPVQLPE